MNIDFRKNGLLLWALFLLISVIGGALIISSGNVQAADTKKPQTTEEKCQQEVTLLNSRAKILDQYRVSENRSYQSNRKQWVKLTTYSGQWVPKDAERVREAIYKYDKLHKAHMDEVSKQMDVFVPLETDPLDCSAAKKDKVAEMQKKATGEKRGKTATGFILIKEKKSQEAKFVNGEFKKATNKMVDKQHKAKAKHPKPSKSMTIVKDPQ